jgi:hypothetical protein
MKLSLSSPGLYVILLLLFGIFFVMGASGHGWNPFDVVAYVMMPSCLLLDLLPHPWAPQTGLFSFLLCSLAGLIQWVLIGYLIDKLLSKWRARAVKPG